MVHKRKQRKIINRHIKVSYLDKQIFFVLIVLYIIGLIFGCAFIFKSNKTTILINQANIISIYAYFLFALIFKYSGILSFSVCFLPLIMGIQNSATYCSLIINRNNITLYQSFLIILKDTAIIMLLILYIILIVSQILNSRYNIKKDIRFLFVYLVGVSIIILLQFIIRKIIF